MRLRGIFRPHSCVTRCARQAGMNSVFGNTFGETKAGLLLRKTWWEKVNLVPKSWEKNWVIHLFSVSPRKPQLNLFSWARWIFTARTLQKKGNGSTDLQIYIKISKHPWSREMYEHKILNELKNRAHSILQIEFEANSEAAASHNKFCCQRLNSVWRLYSRNAPAIIYCLWSN